MKKLLVILICTLTLNASSIDQKIIQLIGNDKYVENKGLINYLFSNENNFYDAQGRLKYIQLLEKLQQNGLINLSFNKPENLTITFNINFDPIKSLKIVSDSLKSLGYYHYFTKKLIYNKENNLIWTINLKTEAAIDPLLLSKEFGKHNCKLLDIKKEGNFTWVYNLDSSLSKLNDVIHLVSGERIDLKKPLKPYMINVSSNNKVLINSKFGNRWFPHIVFYDKHLTIIEIVKKEQRYQTLELEVPEYTKYMKINDAFTLANIKRGLSVTIKEK